MKEVFINADSIIFVYCLVFQVLQVGTTQLWDGPFTKYLSYGRILNLYLVQCTSCSRKKSKNVCIQCYKRVKIMDPFVSLLLNSSEF